MVHPALAELVRLLAAAAVEEHLRAGEGEEVKDKSEEKESTSKCPRNPL